MPDFNSEASAPGVVQLFGEYSTLIGEPALGVAVDHRVTIRTRESPHEFSIIDGYKLDPRKHSIFNFALKKYWEDAPLEFYTLSQIPMVTGLGTRTAVSVALAGLLTSLTMDTNKKPLIKKSNINLAIAHQAFAIENSEDTQVSPLGASTGVLGGTVFLNNAETDALWTVKTGKRTWYIQQLTTLMDVPVVIGTLKERSTSGFTLDEPRPLFDSPIKKPTKKDVRFSKLGKTQKPIEEPIPNKIKRLLTRRGFARDVLSDMGKLTRKCTDALMSGDLKQIGSLMTDQLNLIKMLGVYPSRLRELVVAAEQNSYGVSVTGARGDVIVILTDEPEIVEKDIQQHGGQAIRTKISDLGLIRK